MQQATGAGKIETPNQKTRYSYDALGSVFVRSAIESRRAPVIFLHRRRFSFFFPPITRGVRHEEQRRPRISSRISSVARVVGVKIYKRAGVGEGLDEISQLRHTRRGLWAVRTTFLFIRRSIFRNVVAVSIISTTREQTQANPTTFAK